MDDPEDNGLGPPAARINDRIFICGTTDSGKSVLAHVLFTTIPDGWWKLIIDITDSINEPEALDFYDPMEIPWEEAAKNHRGKMRFIPDIQFMQEQISVLFTQVYEHGFCWYWLDEANEVSDAHKTVFGLRKVLLQGRKAYVGGAACTPRPKDITKSLITQSQFIAVFALIDHDDRATIAKNIGLMPTEFDEWMERLPPFGYLYYDVRNRNLWEIPPIPIEIVEKIENPPIPKR
jgi:hypothetical protein